MSVLRQIKILVKMEIEINASTVVEDDTLICDEIKKTWHKSIEGNSNLKLLSIEAEVKNADKEMA